MSEGEHQGGQWINEELHGLFPPEDRTNLQALLPQTEANHLTFSWDAQQASQESQQQQGQLPARLSGGSVRSLDLSAMPDLGDPFQEPGARGAPGGSQLRDSQQQRASAGLASLPFDHQQRGSGDLPWAPHAAGTQPGSGRGLPHGSPSFGLQDLQQQGSSPQTSLSQSHAHQASVFGALAWPPQNQQSASASHLPNSPFSDFQAHLPQLGSADLRWGLHHQPALGSLPGNDLSPPAAAKQRQASLSQAGWLPPQANASQGLSHAQDFQPQELWQPQPSGEICWPNWPPQASTSQGTSLPIGLQSISQWQSPQQPAPPGAPGWPQQRRLSVGPEDTQAAMLATSTGHIWPSSAPRDNDLWDLQPLQERLASAEKPGGHDWRAQAALAEAALQANAARGAAEAASKAAASKQQSCSGDKSQAPSEASTQPAQQARESLADAAALQGASSGELAQEPRMQRKPSRELPPRNSGPQRQPSQELPTISGAQQPVRELSRRLSAGRGAGAQAGGTSSGGMQRHYSSPTKPAAQQSAPAIIQSMKPRIYTRDPAGSALPAWQGSCEGAQASAAPPPAPTIAQARWASVDTGMRPLSASALEAGTRLAASASEAPPTFSAQSSGIRIATGRASALVLRDTAAGKSVPAPDPAEDHRAGLKGIASAPPSFPAAAWPALGGTGRPTRAPNVAEGQPGEAPKQTALPLPDSPPSFMAASQRLEGSKAAGQGSLLTKRKSVDAQGSASNRMRSSSVQPPSAQHTRVLMEAVVDRQQLQLADASNQVLGMAQSECASIRVQRSLVENRVQQLVHEHELLEKRETQLAAMLAHMSGLRDAPIRGSSQEHSVLQLVELLNDVRLDQTETAEQLLRSMAKRVAETPHEPSWQASAAAGTTSLHSMLATLVTGRPAPRDLSLTLTGDGHAGKRTSLQHVMDLSQQDFARMCLGYTNDIMAILPQAEGASRESQATRRRVTQLTVEMLSIRASWAMAHPLVTATMIRPDGPAAADTNADVWRRAAEAAKLSEQQLKRFWVMWDEDSAISARLAEREADLRVRIKQLLLADPSSLPPAAAHWELVTTGSELKVTINSRLANIISSCIRIALAVFTPLQFATMTVRCSPAMLNFECMVAAGAFPRPQRDTRATPSAGNRGSTDAS